ncbi:TPA: acetyl-CoA C-acetyltransferase [Yersinia enterocolitica]|nr:acetyl-CoA C-acetyltransferase [Yersinia enterocolitica]
MANDVVIVSAARTAIGSFGGSLSNFPAIDLGAEVIKGLVDRAKISKEIIQEVVMGNVLTAGLGQNPARQAALKAGLPIETCAYTINEVCGSGLKAIALAYDDIKCGNADIVIAGGQENMDMAARILSGSRTGKRIGDLKLIDTLINDGLSDAYSKCHMGVTAENIANHFHITRDEQDEFSYGSQQKCRKAVDEGKFINEIVPLFLENNATDTVFDKDEFPRPNTTLEKLHSLKPAFDKNGTVTAGNSTGINNGASAVILMSEKKASKLMLNPMVRIIAWAEVGVEPSLMGTGPIEASLKVLKKANLKIEDLDLIEVNEAFAAQVICINRKLGWDVEKVNVNGGSIALGHPIGASGARILTTLIFEMIRRKSHYGLATLCIGGGMGIAMIVENINS